MKSPQLCAIDVKLTCFVAKVKSNKERATAAADAESENKKRRGSDKENDADTGPSDILGEGEDEDVIF